MENQTIEISLEEYKELRGILEDYQKLIGGYNLLCYVYNQLVCPQEVEEKTKNPIGFKI